MLQQIETTREYCQHHNLVLEKVYVDESKLLSNTEKRDALQEMPADLRRFKRIHDRYKRDTLEGKDKTRALNIIQQFVAKIVVTEGQGTLCYTFPFPDVACMPSSGNLDLRSFKHPSLSYPERVSSACGIIRWASYHHRYCNLMNLD